MAFPLISHWFPMGSPRFLSGVPSLQGSQLPAGIQFASRYLIQQDRQRSGSSATVLAIDKSRQDSADEGPAEVCCPALSWPCPACALLCHCLGHALPCPGPALPCLVPALPCPGPALSCPALPCPPLPCPALPFPLGPVPHILKPVLACLGFPMAL